MFREQGITVAVRPISTPLTFKTDLGDSSVLGELSSQLLYAELLRRNEETAKPVCGSGGRKSAYNTPLHVAALFIILILSTLGTYVPVRPLATILD